MERIAKFEKVSFEQFKKDWIDTFEYLNEYTDESVDTFVRDIYDNIKLPQRATTGSAGYDFYMPSDILLEVNNVVKIPTGIRCQMEEGWVLNIYPRSGLGFKTGLHLANTTGIIDEDYFYADNEGHINIKIVNDSVLAKDIEFKQGDAFCQGMFVPFGITVEDNATAKRTGGFGSTNKTN